MVEHTSYLQEDSRCLRCCKYPSFSLAVLADSRQPVILTTLFVILKAFTRRGYVKLDNDVVALQRAIEYLKQPKRERQTRKAPYRPEVGPTGSSVEDLHDSNEQSPKSSPEAREVRYGGLQSSAIPVVHEEGA